MSKYTNNYAAAAAANGLQYDAVNNVIYGERDGYDFLIYAESKGYPYVMTINTSARRDTSSALNKEEIKELTRSHKAITNASQDGNNINAIMFLRANAKREVLQETMRESINALIAFLNAKGYQPCCSVCGQNVEVSCYKTGLSYMHLCSECEVQMRNNVSNIVNKQSQQDNIAGGIAGALIGSLLGVALIVIIGQLGYVAAISGAVMAYACLKGYERLGGNLTFRGVLISVIIMLVMTYVGNRANWALMAVRELSGYIDYSFFDWFMELPSMLAQVGEKGSYVGTLVMTYAFMVLGAGPTVYNKIKERKDSGRMVKIG